MKYLKTFESSDTHESKSETFWEIDMDEIDMSLLGSLFTDENTDAFIEDNWVEFEYSEYKQIEQILGKLANQPYSSSRSIRKIVTDSDRDRATSIYKLRDEWYYVKTPKYHRGFSIGHNRGVVLDYMKSYYKCDQFDGLIDCLKYIKNKWIIR